MTAGVLVVEGSGLRCSWPEGLARHARVDVPREVVAGLDHAYLLPG